jgi:hypothetical protein
MNDTSDSMARRVAERHLAMTPQERLQVASDMYDIARAIVDSSIPDGLSPAERRLAIARRLYGGDLPEATLRAYAAGPCGA